MTDLDRQIEARKMLIDAAQRAKNAGFSMIEFEESPKAIDFCLQNGVNPSILAHISWYVWKPLR